MKGSANPIPGRSIFYVDAIEEILKDQSGVALVIALLMMIVLTLIGLGSVFTSSFETRLSGNKRGRPTPSIRRIPEFRLSWPTLKTSTYRSIPAEYLRSLHGCQQSQPDPCGGVDFAHDRPARVAEGTGVQRNQFRIRTLHHQLRGEDQIALNPVRSRSTLEEKVIRLVPTLQGGY